MPVSRAAFIVIRKIISVIIWRGSDNVFIIVTVPNFFLIFVIVTRKLENVLR